MTSESSTGLKLELRGDREIVMTRVFHAPRALVFEAHSRPEHIRQWWGLRTNTMTGCDMDFREGGKWRYAVREASGQDFVFYGEYREVVRPDRFTWTFALEGMPGEPIVETMAFEEHDGRTTLTATSVYPDSATRAAMMAYGMEAGANETLDRLEEYVTAMGVPTNEDGELELVLERLFDAPRELVFRAWTEPAHLAQWWGPRGFTNPVCELDVRPGGAIRIDMTDPEGNVYTMGGMFHQITPPERIVFTSNALLDDEGMPRLVAYNTVTFAEHEGGTWLTVQAVIVSAAPEAAGALAGMGEGWRQSLDRLADQVRAMA